MSISSFSLRMLKDFMPFKRVLALGYIDIVSPLDEIESVFDCDLSNPVLNPASQQWHGLKYAPVDSTWLFNRLGVEKLDVIDIQQWRGNEIVADLNEPLTLEAYDLVIDHGTIEHCMNIGQALKNCANAVKAGGYVFHGPPMTMLNHGFYNVCPTLFYDFYVKNGWKIEAMAGMTKTGWFDVPRTDRFLSPNEASVCVIAKRLSDREMRWQMQTKYSKKIEKAA